MTCAESYADANDFATFFCGEVSADDEAQLNRTLRLAATRINMSRQAQGACDCTLSDTSTEYLKYLNCILAIAFYNCKCTNLNVTQEQKQMYMDAAMNDLEMIRKGELELCAGETGADYPAFAWSERSLTSFNTAEIIRNELLRRSG